jgi:hypothetical protein
MSDFRRWSILGFILLLGWFWAAPSYSEDCISFNPNNAQVSNVQGRWKIVDGTHWLFDFGSKKAEADRALQIIKHYGMNQSCFVGRPQPSFSYMLVSGRSPTGSMPGEDCIGFNPANIEVKHINGRWKIVEGSHWIFDFGNKESEARTAFAIIKQHGFNQVCYVGRPQASFQYLKAGAAAVPPTQPPPSGVREDCVSFNPNNAQVSNVQGRWKIVDGSHWLFDFGSKKDEADLALSVIKAYGMNQSCFVGRPQPSFTYMLVSGHAPTGRWPGELADVRCVGFNPANIEVKNINGRWKIVEGSQGIFDFGSKESEARTAFAIIKQHGFSHVCYVGSPQVSFQYLKGERN